MASKRVRTTVTVREDSPVPRRRSKKKQTSGVVILIVLAVLIFLAMNRGQRSAVRGRPTTATAR